MNKLAELSIPTFLEKLAGSEAVPGGGSVAALAGALAASLVEMVGHVTEGKKGYEESAETVEILIEQGSSLRADLLEAVDRDAEAFQEVMDAFKLPKSNDEEKKIRSEAIQAGTRHAAEVPLEVARNCLTAAELALVALRRGNENAASDAGVGAFAALTGLEGALLNVFINLSSIKDADFVKQVSEESGELLEAAEHLREDLWETLRTRIEGLPNA
ncbi:MAG TPA: methenyltetrahydrofolate cyclohydrolase [Cyanobacteria bacterium UBA8530]|nr:methenyltetrahydrofolate cyclohydrolase [Cyanobacteria bacterium UBA8530]